MAFSGKSACQRTGQSGMGLPHSKASRKEWRVIHRASVLECGSPMPLLLLAIWRRFSVRWPHAVFLEFKIPSRRPLR